MAEESGCLEEEQRRMVEESRCLEEEQRRMAHLIQEEALKLLSVSCPTNSSWSHLRSHHTQVRCKVQDKGTVVLVKESKVTDGTVTVHNISKSLGQPGPSTSLTNADSCVLQSSVQFAQPLAPQNTKEVTLNPDNFHKFYPLTPL